MNIPTDSRRETSNERLMVGYNFLLTDGLSVMVDFYRPTCDANLVGPEHRDLFSGPRFFYATSVSIVSPVPTPKVKSIAAFRLYPRTCIYIALHQVLSCMLPFRG